MVLKSIHCTFFLDTNARRVNHINICTSPLNHALSRAIKMAQSSIAQSPNPNTALGLLSTFSTTYTRSPMWWPEKRFKGKNKRSHATSLQILCGIGREMERSIPNEIYASWKSWHNWEKFIPLTLTWPGFGFWLGS